MRYNNKICNITLFILSLLIFNSQDVFSKKSEIVPQAKNWLEIDSTAENDFNNNGFYYLVGFNCKKNESPLDFGKSLVDEQNSRISAVDKPINNIDTPIYDNFQSQKVAAFSSINQKLIIANQEATLSYYIENKELILEIAKKLDYLSERYERIDDFNFYKNTIKPHQDLESLSFNGIFIN